MSSKKGEIMTDREDIVRPKSLKLQSDENNTDKNYLQKDNVCSSVGKDDAVLIKRQSLSEIMEKQEKQDIAASPQQRFNIALQETAKVIENSPKARYFALHKYGSKEKKRVHSDAKDQELYGNHSLNILSYDLKKDKAYGAVEALEDHSHKETEDTAAARYSENVEGR